MKKVLIEDGVEIILPYTKGGVISTGLRNLTYHLIQNGIEASRGFFGGKYGYGAKYENDVFLMHPYCWCEKNDCPWCSNCSGEFEEATHTKECYQSTLNQLQMEHGEWVQSGKSGFWHTEYGTEQYKKYEQARAKLCKEMGLDAMKGCEVHCTCPAEKENKIRYKNCQCDWHLGNGTFRWPAEEAPNFWHKESDFKVHWYKWIGRDQRCNFQLDGGNTIRWHRIIAECIDSLRGATS